MFPLTGSFYFFMGNTEKGRKTSFKNYELSLSLSVSRQLHLSLFCEIRGRINLAVWPIILWCVYSYVATRIRLHLFHELRDERVKERLIFIIRSSLENQQLRILFVDVSLRRSTLSASFDPRDEYRPFASTITNWVMRWNTWCRLVHNWREIKHLDSLAIEFAKFVSCSIKIIVA